MNYPQIAAVELLETPADRLFLYCWSMLRSRESAQTAHLVGSAERWPRHAADAPPAPPPDAVRLVAGAVALAHVGVPVGHHGPGSVGIVAALSWNGDRRPPFASRAGRAPPPDRPGTGRALSRRVYRAELHDP